LHMAQLMPLPLIISCSSKSRLVLPFWCWLTWEVQDKIQEDHKTVVCVYLVSILESSATEFKFCVRQLPINDA